MIGLHFFILGPPNSIVHCNANPHRPQTQKRSISSVKFSDDDKLIATSSADKTARTWSTSDGYPLQEFVGHEQGISDVAFSSDARYLATASDGKTTPPAKSAPKIRRVPVKGGDLQTWQT